MSLRAALAGTLLLLSLPCAGVAAAPDFDLERQVLARDWPALIGRVHGAEAPAPELRFLAGHGFLATNRANDAMCLFAAGASEADRAAWLDWTAQLVQRHPASAIAQYLNGDALARREDWPAAQAAFGRAQALAPADPLVLNASAVAAAGAGEWAIAKALLVSAAQAPSPPLDVTTNQGVLAVLHRDDPDVADRHFATVEARVPDHVVALVGRGNAATTARHWLQARDYYRRALDASSCTPLALDNMLLLQEAELAEQRETAAMVLASSTPGTEMFKTMTTTKAALDSGFDGVHTSTFDAAGAVRALDASGNLSVRNLQDTNTSLKAFAMSLNTAGNTAAALGDAGGIFLALKGQFVPAAASFLGGHTAQTLLDTEANILDKAYDANQAHIDSLQTAGWKFSMPTPASADPGGMRSAPLPQTWDRGDWPVVIWPVLLYSLAPSVSH